MTLHPPSLKLWTDPDVRKVAEEVDARYPRNDWTSTYPGHGDNGPKYAIDFMCGKTVGDKIAAYVWKNRKRLGVWYVIWYGRIISETRPSAGWQRYYAADDPNPSKSHKNHVHVSFYPGRTFQPLPTNKPAGVTRPVEVEPGARREPTDRIIYLDKLKPGIQNSDSVYWLQTLLNKVNGPNVLRSGDYNTATVDLVKTFQKAMDDDVIDGDIGELGLVALIQKAGRGYQNFVVEKKS